MTEAEWLTTTDVEKVLSNLSGPLSARKLRLAYCACLRSDAVWPFVVSKSSRRAVEISEQFAEEQIGARELRTARTSAHSAWARIGPLKPPQYAAAELAHNACWLDAMLLREALVVLRRLVRAGLPIPAAPLREIFGNPFRTVEFNPAWRTSDVVLLARGIYEERAFDRMPILADALQDAGCDNDEMLNHLRAVDVIHVRGCWALDLVLGKE
ncbi:MAG: hypothetical protein L0241_29760 [Planctomycetia bacterium]|nr:hypothetical protein [Planctomycetia bacterium]